MRVRQRDKSLLTHLNRSQATPVTVKWEKLAKDMTNEELAKYLSEDLAEYPISLCITNYDSDILHEAARRLRAQLYK